jgi:hypothetical protein
MASCCLRSSTLPDLVSAFLPAAVFAWLTQNLSWAPIAELRAAVSKSGTAAGVETTSICVCSEDKSAGVRAVETKRARSATTRGCDMVPHARMRDVPEVLDRLLDCLHNFFRRHRGR